MIQKNDSGHLLNFFLQQKKLQINPKEFKAFLLIL